MGAVDVVIEEAGSFDAVDGDDEEEFVDIDLARAPERDVVGGENELERVVATISAQGGYQDNVGELDFEVRQLVDVADINLTRREGEQDRGLPIHRFGEQGEQAVTGLFKRELFGAALIDETINRSGDQPAQNARQERGAEIRNGRDIKVCGSNGGCVRKAIEAECQGNGKEAAQDEKPETYGCGFEKEAIAIEALELDARVMALAQEEKAAEKRQKQEIPRHPLRARRDAVYGKDFAGELFEPFGFSQKVFIIEEYVPFDFRDTLVIGDGEGTKVLEAVIALEEITDAHGNAVNFSLVDNWGFRQQCGCPRSLGLSFSKCGDLHHLASPSSDLFDLCARSEHREMGNIAGRGARSFISNNNAKHCSLRVLDGCRLFGTLVSVGGNTPWKQHEFSEQTTG